MSVLGNKYECVECGVKFYDLGRAKAVCPSCGTDQNEVPVGEDEKEEPKPKRRDDSGDDESVGDDLDEEDEDEIDEDDLEELDELEDDADEDLEDEDDED